MGVPLTSKVREGEYYFKYVFDGRLYTALLMQLRLYDCRRLQRLVGVIQREYLFAIRERLAHILLKINGSLAGASEHSDLESKSVADLE